MFYNLRQILRDVWNVRQGRQHRDVLTLHVDLLRDQHAATKGNLAIANASAAAWEAYAKRGERRYAEAVAVMDELQVQLVGARLRDGPSDAVQSAWAILGENSSWRTHNMGGRVWSEKQQAKREAIDRQNATVGLPPSRPPAVIPKTWGERPEGVCGANLPDLFEDDGIALAPFDEQGNMGRSRAQP